MQKAIELLESVLDLQLGSINIDEWLKRLAVQTNSAAAFSASWPAQRPDLAEDCSSSKYFALDAKYLPALDRIITLSSPEEPGFIEDIMQPDDSLSEPPESPLNDPAWMIAYLDSYPACIIIALRCPDRPGGWTDIDRNIFRKVLPVLRKAHLLHKEATLARNRLNIANTILDTSPRGLISLNPRGEILHTNSMAINLLSRSDAITQKNGMLEIRNDLVAVQFAEKLATVRTAPIESLNDFVWNRSFQNIDKSQLYQLSLSAHRVKDWRFESTPYDRFLVIFISAPEFRTLPTTEELSDFYDLTRAQARLTIALMEGKSVEQSAHHLHISVNTIRSHLRSIYAKLGTDNRADLLRIISMTLISHSNGKT